MVIHFSCLYGSKILNIKQYLLKEYKDGCYIMSVLLLFVLCSVWEYKRARSKKRECVCKPVGLLDAHAHDFYTLHYVCLQHLSTRVNVSVNSWYMFMNISVNACNKQSSHILLERWVCALEQTDWPSFVSKISMLTEAHRRRSQEHS